MYGNVEIKYSKFGVDDFDFAYGHIIHVGCRLANLVAVTTIKRLTLGWRHILRTRTPTRYCSYCALPL